MNNITSQITKKFTNPGLCDICNKYSVDMVEEEGYIGKYKYFICYCVHHTQEELLKLYNQIETHLRKDLEDVD